MKIRAVYFDVGETLIDETRQWRGWASCLGVPTEVFFSAFRELVEAGEDHRCIFQRFRPGFDLEAARKERAANGDADIFDQRDLYPDAVPCLRALRKNGLAVGIVGNQPAESIVALRVAGVDADVIASSETWGVEKPSPAFFAKVATTAALPAAAIAYVGDRLDNDVLPARAAGRVAVFLGRGPWGRVHARRPEAKLADIRLKNLAELPGALAAL